MLEVTDDGLDGFLVRVRSGRRLRPHTLVVGADERSRATDHLTGEPSPADDVHTWTHGVVMMLMELLDTRGLRWARRITLSDGTVAIDPTLEPVLPSPWWISPVPVERPTRSTQRRLRPSFRGRRTSHLVTVGDSTESEPDPLPGGHLRDMAFDVRPARAAHTDGRLIQWLQLALDDNINAPTVGQLVVAWREASDDVVLLAHLEFTPAVPAGAVEELVLAGVHAAADAGAQVIEYRPDNAEHLHRGLLWQQDGGILRLQAADVP